LSNTVASWRYMKSLLYFYSYRKIFWIPIWVNDIMFPNLLTFILNYPKNMRIIISSLRTMFDIVGTPICVYTTLNFVIDYVMISCISQLCWNLTTITTLIGSNRNLYNVYSLEKDRNPHNCDKHML